ncbi:hypothetical protein DFH08DRAFT_936358 [Mycena albidolilacea]|uniref:DUF6533 domain-containing protein n=1 Tax=Mycena albidolilacea TaxID=1033008 RepID=A0AAD7A2L1_9AGAR|nr:hypothetical protein DFH08DRAFT_936358 [Mycena albidolilacea]
MSLLSPDANPNFLQGSAIAAVTWVMYDVCLTWDRELSSVWRSSWSISKILFIFSRYHTIFALGFFLMEAIGTKHFTLRTGTGGPLPTNPDFWAPCKANLPVSYVSRWYLGLTEVLSIMSGEFMILIRINAVYGWSRHAESVIGFTTTIMSIRGGAKGLLDSTEILTCNARQGYIPDVNVSTHFSRYKCIVWCTSMMVVGIYLILVVHKAKDIAHVIDGAEGQLTMKKVGHLFAFQTTNMTPTLHVSVDVSRYYRNDVSLIFNLRFTAIYFGVVFCVLLVNLVLVLGTLRWLLATYSVADLSVGARYNESSWSKFQENSALEMQPRTVDAERPADPPEAHVFVVDKILRNIAWTLRLSNMERLPRLRRWSGIAVPEADVNCKDMNEGLKNKIHPSYVHGD